MERKIRALGDVNVGAIEQYKEVKERFEFLTAQREDILAAEEKLRQIIEELSILMEQQFREQFKVISENFSEVFREMFGGGRAQLRLTDAAHVLESPIEIVAQPPGKNLQNMQLLSGGERALTAIAILFSILKMKPSPFCILDEIEAALDDANVSRYAQYLKKFAEETQFIVITHRKGTMEHADVLYGVTMPEQGVSKVYVHAFLDGRDVPPASAAEDLEQLQAKMNELGVGKIASVMGRFYAMDRDNIWDRVEKAYAAMVYGEGVQATDAVAAVRASYETVDEDGKHLTDEFVLPTVVGNEGRVHSGESVIFFNFRPDRAREITRAFVDPAFTGFDRKGGALNPYFVCMTQYDAEMPCVHVAFGPESLENTFGEYLSKQGKTQLRIAETQKYAHVTFFFNGGVEAPFEGEDRALIPSPKVATYDLQPEMSAPQVSEKLNEAVRSGKYDVVIVNFANCDMVGHTGIIPAAVKAVETVDACVGSLVQAVKDMDGVLFVTADHGNADKMIADDGTPHTAHTTALVPFALADGAGAGLKLNGEQGALCDIAPTLLAALGMESPKEFTGRSLLV